MRRLNTCGLIGLMLLVFSLDVMSNMSIQNGTCRIDPNYPTTYRFEGERENTDGVISAYTMNNDVPCHTSPVSSRVVRPGHYNLFKSAVQSSVTVTCLLFFTAVVIDPIVLVRV